MASNVLGGELEPCSKNPVTGFFRNGLCDTCADDRGMHTVCVVMTDEFLEFSAEAGNDLSTPVPEFQFPGLKAGDRWCLCMGRWIEAQKAGMAPEIVLESCHLSVTEFVDLELLKQYAVKGTVAILQLRFRVSINSLPSGSRHIARCGGSPSSS